jgi:hypothetical protein
MSIRIARLLEPHLSIGDAGGFECIRFKIASRSCSSSSSARRAAEGEAMAPKVVFAAAGHAAPLRVLPDSDGDFR